MTPEPAILPEPAMEAFNADEFELEGQLAQDGIPESPDCSSDTLPTKTEPKPGKKTLLLPDLVSMWKYMLSSNYANRRLLLYSFLNQALRKGQLSETVGFRVLNRVINRDACEIKGVSFWKINRKNFYADVEVKLTLQSSDGLREWNGILECWCSFEGVYDMTVESLSKGEDRDAEGYVRLSPFLVPYMTNQMMDKFAEQVWIDYGLPEAIGNPSLRNATKLAKRMGLTMDNAGHVRVLMEQEVYLDFLRGKPYARMTILHEVGHIHYNDMLEIERDGMQYDADRLSSIESGEVHEREIRADAFAARFLGKETVREGLTVLRDNDIAEGYAPSIQELSRRIHILGGTTVPSKGSSAGGESSCGSIYAPA